MASAEVPARIIPGKVGGNAPKSAQRADGWTAHRDIDKQSTEIPTHHTEIAFRRCFA
jgi:hypothetical protein